MKNRMKLITSVCIMILFLTSNPVLATTIEDLGHSWNDNFFSIEADVNQPKDNSIYLVDDLTQDPVESTDVNPAFNNQLFFSYINQSDMEVGYLALEKLEKTTPIKYNRTTPFQALFTHFTSPSGADVFCVVNFDGLIAYSGGGDFPRRLDRNDEIYIGLTFGGQGLADLLSIFYLLPNKLDALPHWDVTPFFEQIDDTHYSFGVTYHNLLVAWLSLGNIEADYDKLGQELAGPQLKAISLFDNVTYRYDVSFETDETGLTIANIAANYDFGSTEIIAIGYENTPEVDDPEEKAGTGLEELADAREDIEGVVVNIPDLTPFKPEEHSAVMIYTEDLAKLRIYGPREDTPGFGLAVINSANIITVGKVDIQKDGQVLNPAAAEEVGSVSMIVDGEKTFESDYKTKGTYDLIWANGSVFEDKPVINTIIPTKTPGFNTPYFILQRLILVPWLLVIAKEISTLQQVQEKITLEHYFIATQFPFWSGGRIIHDPSFTAYSNPEVIPKTTTSEAPMTTTSEAPMTSTTVREFALPELLLTTSLILPIILIGFKRQKK